MKKAADAVVVTSAIDQDSLLIAVKLFFDVSNDKLLNAWLPRVKITGSAVPLKNSIIPQSSYAKVTTWHDGAIGYLLANGNQF